MIADHKGEIPFVVLIVPYLLGIGFGLNLFAGASISWLMCAACLLALAFFALNIWYKRLSVYKYRWLGGLLITLLLFIFGLTGVIKYREVNNSDHFSKMKGRFMLVKISNEPILKGGIVRFTAEVEAVVANRTKQQASGTILIALKDSTAKNLYYGDELLIPAKYNAVEPPYNPAEFNYKGYLANQNIYYQSFLFAKQYALLGSGNGNPLIAHALRLRQRLVEKLKNNLHEPEAVAVASTLILGYKADLSSDVLQAYSKTGTIHVLSVSGAHVAIIYILLNLGLAFLTRFKYGRAIKAVVIILLIWYYSMISGFSPAVCRAAVMISMVIIGKSYDRYINTLNILAISAFALLIYDPLFITDVGFQLSYIAVFGLIVFQPLVYQQFKFKNKWVDKLWALCSVSIAAQVITFPLSAFYFHQFPVYFLISNLFIIIPSAVIMYSGLLFLLLPHIPVVSKALAYVLEQSILLMDNALAFIEHLPYASIGKLWLTTTEYLLAYVVIIALFYFLYDRKLWLIKLSLVCVLLLSVSFSIKRIMAINSSAITFLNLKKHKAIVFKHGLNAVVLTDIDAHNKIYQYSVQPYLDSLKVSNTEVLSLNNDARHAWMDKKGKFIQFLNTRVLLADTGFSLSDSLQKIQTDYIYITGNPRLTPLSVNKAIDYKLLIMDGSNTDKIINSFIGRGNSQNKKFVVLKRNKSVTLVSNKY